MPTPPRDRPPDEPGGVYSDRLQIWLPDTSSPEFAAEAHRQSLLAARSPQEQEDIDFVESISWLVDSPSDDG